MMNISNTGIALIEKWEGMKLKSYLCPAGKWTIGIGSTIVDGGAVKEGMSCTKEQAYQYLRDHLLLHVYPAFKYVKVELTQNQFDALCSLIYNIGITNFKSSTLLKYLNLSQTSDASMQFLVWNKAKGKVLKGLSDRRKDEKHLFDS